MKDTDKLREKAELFLDEAGTVNTEKQLLDAKILVQELKVHQIELEMQNAELIRAQNALEEAKSEYAELYDAAPAGYVTLDETGYIVKTNQTFAGMVGREAHHLPGHSFAGFMGREAGDAFHIFFRKGMKQDAVRGHETQFVGADGSHFWGLLDISEVKPRENGERRFNVVILDITARKEAEKETAALEKRLRQTQKMEALGTMAGGIAHDVNNILAIIVGYSEFIRDDAPEESPVRKNAEEVLSAADRARNLIKQILAFSRHTRTELVPMKLHGHTRETVKLLRSTIPTTVDIVDDLDSQCGVVAADPTQISQIVMNLCMNAVHAMDERGVLTVALKEVTLDGEYLKHQPDPAPGPYVRLCVTDTGCGMDAATMDRIYDPFFTTKGVGEGTGMGLSVVHGIVEEHGGIITVDSEPGKGSRFQVFFPRIDAEIAEPAHGDAPLPAGTERVLVVDDEAAIANFIKIVLRRQGYDVTARTSSVEALETFRANPKGFDLVVTDQTMPHLSGGELAVELSTIRPDIPILLCTGYSHKVTADNAESFGIKAFCMKPLGREDLIRAVRRALDAS